MFFYLIFEFFLNSNDLFEFLYEFFICLVKHISLGINNIVFHCYNLFHCSNLLNFNSVMKLQILFNYFAFHRVHLFMT